MIDDTLETPSNMNANDTATPNDALIFIPAGKLDADQYTVSDLDGVTESLFGSGNMNFLMMQSAQTNELAATRAGIDFMNGNDLPLTSGTAALSGNSLPTSGNNGFDGFGHRAGSDPYNAIEFSDVSGGGNHAAAATSLSNLGGSSSSGGSSSFAFVQNVADGGGTSTSTPPAPPVNGVNGSNGSNGSDGTNGSNGSNGSDGSGTGDTIINNITEVVENITNVTVLDTTNLVENITNNVTDILTTVTNNVFNTVNNILDGNLQPFPVGLDLLLNLDKITNLNLDFFAGNTIINVINETLDTTLITNITDMLTDIATVLNVNLLIFPFTPDNSPNDQDLTVVGDFHLPFLPPIDIAIPLDPIEALLGDIDLNIDLTNEILNGLLGGNEADTDLDINTGIAILDNTLLNDGVNVLLNPIENLLGDVDLAINLGLDLFGNSETINSAGDTDIVLPLDLEIVNSDILNDVLHINLDPIEAITGDIDLDITAAVDLLGQAAANLLDPENGGNGEDGLLTFLGDVAENLVSPLLPADSGSDTDIGLDLVTSILNQPLADNTLDIALNPLEDLVGDLDVLSALDIDFIDSPLPDIDGVLLASVDLLGDVAAPLIDNALGGSSSETPLSWLGDEISSAVEDILHAHDNNLLGDTLSALDNVLDGALDVLENAPMLGNVLDLSILDQGATAATDLVWTENLISDTAGLLGGGLGGDLSNILPDPVGILPDLAATATNLLGGEKLFGGLFG